ncbi:MAG: class I SAM-dependent methyltransferase [Nocardioidaceae bacterium]|nr:class I SAM-dependent methyltransferase [Nocardioidaceae bacterium]
MQSGRSAYYDAEAARYDASRGGSERADDAARAVRRLVPGPGVLLDVGGGTGIVSAALAAQGFDVLVTDLSTGMLALARDRLPGRAMAALADRLPVRPGSVDVVTAVWLLHLLAPAEADGVLAEAARVLRPGGHLVTTVDKRQAHGQRGAVADDRARVTEVAARLGLVPAGETTFTGASAWGSATDADPVFPLAAFRSGR